MLPININANIRPLLFSNVFTHFLIPIDDFLYSFCSFPDPGNQPAESQTKRTQTKPSRRTVYIHTYSGVVSLFFLPALVAVAAAPLPSLFLLSLPLRRGAVVKLEGSAREDVLMAYLSCNNGDFNLPCSPLADGHHHISFSKFFCSCASDGTSSHLFF